MAPSSSASVREIVRPVALRENSHLGRVIAEIEAPRERTGGQRVLAGRDFLRG
jgi:hypothetical protein